jgi:EmrB/QacA subfamily drug resistance transporter
MLGRGQARLSSTVRDEAPTRPELALAVLCAVLFLTFLDNTIVSVAIADMQTSLRAGVSSLQWIVDGYMLAFTGLMLTGGTLGDLLGRRKVMLGGIALFCAGSLVGALAPDTRTLIAGRVVMGVGAAACEPGTLSIIRQIFPDRRERARALGIWTAVSGISLALGPVLGGVLVAGAGWRGIFWFNLAFGAAMFTAAALTIPESADPEGRRLDVPGLLAGAVAVTGVTFAVIEGENVGYGTWWVPILFAVAAVAAVLFVVIERHARDPVLRLEFFRRRAFSVATAVAFATSFGLFAVFFFTALYLQIVAGFSGWKIALQFVAMSLAMVVAGRVAGVWTAVRGSREPMAAGCLLAGGAMFGVDALLAPNVSFAPLAAALAGVGFGLGLALVAVTAAVLTIVPAERSGMAASTVNTSREFGGVLAVATLGAVVNAQLVGELGRKLTALGVPEAFRSLVIDAVTHGGLPANAAAAAKANPVAASNFGLIGRVLKSAEVAFGHGLHAALVVAAAILIGGALVALLPGGSGRRAAELG